jgi:hypothetical protein
MASGEWKRDRADRFIVSFPTRYSPLPIRSSYTFANFTSTGGPLRMVW